jgi:hypothetical protein
MALSALMKKNKRALINFQEDFLIPFIEKAAWRFMQFAPERYPVQDFDFVPTSTLGMVAREYEQQQMVGLMQTLGPNSPITPVLLQGIIQSSSLSNRDEIVETLKKMSEPNPQAQQMQQAQQQMELQTAQANLSLIDSQAKKYNADAIKTTIEAQILPKETEAKMIGNISRNSADGSEFNQKIKIAELALKEKEINHNMDVVKMQMQDSREKHARDIAFKEKVSSNG